LPREEQIELRPENDSMLSMPSQRPERSPPKQNAAVSVIGLSDIMCIQTIAIVHAWKKWRGWRAMPASKALLRACLGAHAQHASVARVIEDGRDYEFKYIGEAHVRAYGANHQGRRVSDIARLSPRFGRQLKASYDLVRISGRPQAFQGVLDSDNAGPRFVWFETVYLPFGEQGAIDCILNAAVYQLRADRA
jgi:hypothetical protein